MMWLEDCQCPVTIALSEVDGILPVRAVLAQAQMLTHSEEEKEAEEQEGEGEGEASPKVDRDVRVVMWRDFVHGQVLMDQPAQQELRQVMEDQLAGIEPLAQHRPHTARFA